MLFLLPEQNITLNLPRHLDSSPRKNSTCGVEGKRWEAGSNYPNRLDLPPLLTYHFMRQDYYTVIILLPLPHQLLDSTG